MAREIDLEVGLDHVTVDGVDATVEIRGPQVSQAVSVVAANPAVRAEMVSRQREWAHRRGGGVLEGRDIGTVVFPDAELKVYLTADPEPNGPGGGPRRSPTSTTRRSRPTSPAAMPSDSSRTADPLTEAADAVVVDTTGLTIDEVVTNISALLDGPAGGDAA